jgi:hypothetical protein
MAKRKTPPSQVDDSSMNTSDTAHTSTHPTPPRVRRSRAGLPREAREAKTNETTEMTEITEVTEIRELNESPTFDLDGSADLAESMTANVMSSASSIGHNPSEEEIRERAYQRFLQRGSGHGDDFQDWLEAERELKANRHH